MLDFYPEGSCKTASSYCIDAVLEFDLVERIVAADRIQQRTQLANPYGDDELAMYNDFIDNVYNTIGSFGFDMLNEYQSPHSYSYYVVFRPKDLDGNPIDEIVEVRFRISDHPLTGGSDNFGRRRLFRSFVLGGERYDNPVSLILGVERVCEAMQRRDFSALMRV